MGTISICGRVVRKALRRPIACVLWKPLTTSITETVEGIMAERPGGRSWHLQTTVASFALPMCDK